MYLEESLHHVDKAGSCRPILSGACIASYTLEPEVTHTCSIRTSAVSCCHSSSSSAPASATAAQAPQQHSAPVTAPPAAVSQPPPASDGAAVLDKQIKTLGKKVRQCQALLYKQSTGEPLSHQEQEKVSKMSSW